ncbi:hypothetical protein [Pseudomonas phage vB_Pa-PAC2]
MYKAPYSLYSARIYNTKESLASSLGLSSYTRIDISKQHRRYLRMQQRITCI